MIRKKEFLLFLVATVFLFSLQVQSISAASITKTVEPGIITQVLFTDNEMHEDNTGFTPDMFDFGETVYNDVDASSTVSAGDTRLANAATQGFFDGSVVADGDSDLGLALVGFSDNEMHEDNPALTPDTFDVGETVYNNVDSVGEVSAGDTRLANAATQGFFDGSEVTCGDGDLGLAFVGFAPSEMHEDSGATENVFDASETIYNDVDPLGEVSAGDTRLANAATQGFFDGSVVADGDSDLGLALVGFSDNEMHEDNPALTSDTFDVGETVYNNVDSVGEVSAGDTRLANAATQGFFDGSEVTCGDGDLGLTLVFRDITNLDPTPEPTASFDKAEYNPGDTAIVTITDFNGNLDPSMRDSITATYGLLEIILDETNINNGIFSGAFTITESNELTFMPDLPESARATVTLDLADETDVTLRDVPITDADIPNIPFEPVIHALEVELDDSDALTPGSPIVVTLSFANGAFLVNDEKNELDFACLMDMFYKPPESSVWERVLDVTVDCGEPLLTYTSGATTELGTLVTEGQFSLGFPTDLGGGGGGSITRAGLVVNALGVVKASGALGGGGGGGNSPPSFGQSSFSILSGGEEGFGGILTDNDSKTLEETKTVKVGEKAVLRFDYVEGGGVGKIEHIGLYMNVRDGQKRHDSDAYIYYDPLKSPQVTIHDPNGRFSEVNVSLLPKDATNFVLKVEVTFAKTMPKSDFILEGWNTQKWSSITKITNAIEVVSSGLVQQSESEPIVDTFVEDVVNDQVIPVWIKSNAGWWSGDTIDNETFVSGIEYLVNEGIIKVTLPNSNNPPSISELQPWIKNTAGWWANDMISDDEFLAAIEWLILNGIIQVV